MVLFLFVIMFLNISGTDQIEKPLLVKLAAVISGGSLFVIMIAVLRTAPAGTFDPATFNSQIGMVETLGMVLYRDFILPFELVSVLFLVSMVGAVMLGKKEVGERHF